MSAQPFLSRIKVNLYPHRFMTWRRRGLSTRAATAVAIAGCDTVEEITRLGRAYFEGRPNCAKTTLAELAAIAGWPPKFETAVGAIAAALALSMADPEEAREAAADAIIALQRSGFVIVAQRTRG